MAEPNKHDGDERLYLEDLYVGQRFTKPGGIRMGHSGRLQELLFWGDTVHGCGHFRGVVQV